MDRPNRPETNEVLNTTPMERSITPEQTLHHIQPLIKEAGISRLANITHLDTLGVPVYTAIRPLSKSLSTAQGKGLTIAQAQCGAYMEAIECYYAENIPSHLTAAAKNIPKTDRCFEDLPPGLTIANPDQIIDWTFYTDYHTQKKIQVPTHFLSLNLTAARAENGWFNKTTAGLASGNSREEALTYSLYELIERHDRKKFHGLPNIQKKNKVLNLTTLPQGATLQLIHNIHKEHTQCLIFYMHSSFELPTFYCLLTNTHPLRQIGQYEGYGAHWNAEIALRRAILEAAQSRLTYIAGSRDDMMPSHYAHIQVEALSWPGQVLFDHIPSHTISVSEQLHQLQHQLKHQGFDQHLYVELTPPNSPVSVVHSIIPGFAL